MMLLPFMKPQSPDHIQSPWGTVCRVPVVQASAASPAALLLSVWVMLYPHDLTRSSPNALG